MRTVRKLFADVEDQVDFLETLQQTALVGSSTDVADRLSSLQDWASLQVSAEAASSQFIRSMDNATIATLCEAALQRIEAEDSAGGAIGDPGTQYADFSTSPSRLG